MRRDTASGKLVKHYPHGSEILFRICVIKRQLVQVDPDFERMKMALYLKLIYV